MPARDDDDFEETRAYCRLPQMDIDIVHRRARAGDGEFMTINVEIVPFSERFDRLFAMSDPFRFWGEMAELAWWPWLQGLRFLSPQDRRLPPKEGE